MRLNRIIFGLFVLSLISCKKDKPEHASVSNFNNGLIVLCEGLFQQNNASVSWISKSDQSVTNQIFYSNNNRYLGDTGNDLLRYGSRIYIAINASSTIEVLESNSFKSIAQIQMESGGMEKQPRYLESYNGRVYSSCFDGFVDVIDTITNTVVNRIPVGLNPDGIRRISDRLYVANSGGLNFPTMDSTLSVIDLNTESEINRLTVGLNPGDLEADTQGELYVVARGNYSSEPSKLIKVDPTSFQMTKLFEGAMEISPFVSDRFLITYDNGGGVSIGLFNTALEQWENANFISTADISTVYEVVFDQQNQLIYVLDAMGYTNSGYVKEYTLDGVFVRSYRVGLNPTDLIYLP